jgi:hypothetical protein
MNNNYYVYFILDPTTSQPFYVGKGSGNRADSHLMTGRSRNKSSKRVQDKIKSLRGKGIEPVIQLFQEGMCETAAYDLEEAQIKIYGRKGYDANGILMNICENSRPPRRVFQTVVTRGKISASMIGKNIGKIPWNKGIPHKRGEQKAQQTIHIMETRLKNLLHKIFEHYATVNDSVIKECRDKKIISYNAPISEAALHHIFKTIIRRKEDIPQ